VTARGSVRRLLDLVAAQPGITLARLVEVTGGNRESVMGTLRRYEAAGHVSSDDVDGHRCYWLEVAPGPTLLDRICTLLSKGPATWGEIQAGVGRTGMAYAVTALEHAGRIVVEQRTARKPDGRTVHRPSIYRLAVQ